MRCHLPCGTGLSSAWQLPHHNLLLHGSQVPFASQERCFTSEATQSPAAWASFSALGAAGTETTPADLAATQLSSIDHMKQMDSHNCCNKVSGGKQHC